MKQLRESREKPGLTRDHCHRNPCAHRLQGTVFVSARGRGQDKTAVCDHRGVHAGRPPRKAWVAEVGLATTAVYDPKGGLLASWPLQKPVWVSEVGDKSPRWRPLRLQLPPSCDRCRPLCIPSWEHMQLHSARDLRPRANCPGGVHDPPQTIAAFLRPQPLHVLPAHANCVCCSLCLPSPTEQVSANQSLLSPPLVWAGSRQQRKGQNQSWAPGEGNSLLQP